MPSRTALILETPPVIPERYLQHTNASNWRIMLTGTLNEFLEKLQHEQFDLIVAEESLLPQAIIQMMKSIGIPFLLSTNTKNPEIATMPRNFNRTELLTVFDRLAPETAEEQHSDEAPKEENAAKELFSDLEDEEETFELTSDAVILDPGKAQDKEPETEDNAEADTLFSDEKAGSSGFDAAENGSAEDFLFGDDSEEEISRPETTQVTPAPAQEEAAPEEEKPEPVEETKADEEEGSHAPDSGDAGSSDDAVKAAVKEWLDKNARSLIKEIVLEQLASLSGKNNG